jgi:hypothetical protein
MMRKLLEDHLKEEAGIKQPQQTAEQVKEEAEMRIAHQRSMIQQEARAAAARQQALAQQQQAAAQQQQTAQQQVAAQQQQQKGYGGLFSSGDFSGGRIRKHKSPSRKNKTRKSRKARRLYKSRKRRR